MMSVEAVAVQVCAEWAEQHPDCEAVVSGCYVPVRSLYQLLNLVAQAICMANVHNVPCCSYRHL